MIKKVKKTNNRITGLYLAIVFIAFGVFATRNWDLVKNFFKK